MCETFMICRENELLIVNYEGSFVCLWRSDIESLQIAVYFCRLITFQAPGGIQACFLLMMWNNLLSDKLLLPGGDDKHCVWQNSIKTHHCRTFEQKTCSCIWLVPDSPKKMLLKYTAIYYIIFIYTALCTIHIVSN